MGRPVSNSTGPGTPMPTPHSRPGRPCVVRRSDSKSVVDAVEADLRTGLDVGRLVVVAEDPAIEASSPRHRCWSPRGRRPGRGRRPPGTSAGGAAGRPCSARRRPRRPARARSARRPVGRRSPGRGPSASTSSERDRERPSRISSRTVTNASSASSGSGANAAAGPWHRRPLAWLIAG